MPTGCLNLHLSFKEQFPVLLCWLQIPTGWKKEHFPLSLQLPMFSYLHFIFDFTSEVAGFSFSWDGVDDFVFIVSSFGITSLAFSLSFIIALFYLCSFSLFSSASIFKITFSLSSI